jgi:hypothetical protein
MKTDAKSERLETKEKTASIPARRPHPSFWCEILDYAIMISEVQCPGILVLLQFQTVTVPEFWHPE